MVADPDPTLKKIPDPNSTVKKTDLTHKKTSGSAILVFSQRKIGFVALFGPMKIGFVRTPAHKTTDGELEKRG